MIRSPLLAIALILVHAALAPGQAPEPILLPGQPVPGIAGSILGAEMPLPVPPPGPNLGWAKFPGNALVPGSPYAPPPGGYVPPPPAPEPYLRCPCLNHLGMCCWADHNQFGCSSLYSTLTFQFGSCRAFFGERCMQGPPQLPIPNGIGTRTIYPR